MALLALIIALVGLSVHGCDFDCVEDCSSLLGKCFEACQCEDDVCRVPGCYTSCLVLGLEYGEEACFEECECRTDDKLNRADSDTSSSSSDSSSSSSSSDSEENDDFDDNDELTFNKQTNTFKFEPSRKTLKNSGKKHY
jgi:hypothetical protein